MATQNISTKGSQIIVISSSLPLGFIPIVNTGTSRVLNTSLRGGIQTDITIDGNMRYWQNALLHDLEATIQRTSVFFNAVQSVLLKYNALPFLIDGNVQLYAANLNLPSVEHFYNGVITTPNGFGTGMGQNVDEKTVKMSFEQLDSVDLSAYKAIANLVFSSANNVINTAQNKIDELKLMNAVENRERKFAELEHKIQNILEQEAQKKAELLKKTKSIKKMFGGVDLNNKLPEDKNTTK